MEAFFDGVIAGYGIAIPVGPIAVLIVDLGARHGFGAAFSAGLGAATADLLYATVAAVAGVAAAAALAPYADPLRLAGGIVLILIALWLAFSVFRPAPDRETPATSNRRLFAGFLSLTMANPVTLTYFASLVLGRTSGVTGGAMAMFVGGAFLASLSWQTLLAGTGVAFGSRVSARTRDITGLLGAAVIVYLAIRMLW